MPLTIMLTIVSMISGLTGAMLLVTFIYDLPNRPDWFWSFVISLAVTIPFLIAWFLKKDEQEPDLITQSGARNIGVAHRPRRMTPTRGISHNSGDGGTGTVFVVMAMADANASSCDISSSDAGCGGGGGDGGGGGGE